MKDKQVLKNGLAAIRKKAAANYNHTTVGDILSCFGGAELEEDEIRLIYQYLEEEHIIIEDYKPRDTRAVTLGEPVLSGEEKAYFQMYLDDLESISPCTQMEEDVLLQHLLAGDESAKNRLIEGNLHLVLEIARKRAGQGVLVGDLVQEGNMILVMAIEEYHSFGVKLQGESFGVYLQKQIDTGMKALLQEHGGYAQVREKMARQANHLLDVTEKLEEELGREVTLAELAAEMKIPESEVEEIMRVSMSAMELGDRAEQDESHHDHENYGHDHGHQNHN